MNPESYTQLLRFAESIANHTSGNMHGWYPGEVTAARRAVKAAGGELREMGRYRAGESEPMSHEEYSKRKDERKVERVKAALLLGPVRFVSDDIYDINMKRVCTHGELVGWIRARLKNQGLLLVRHGPRLDLSWSLYQPKPQNPT